MEKERFIMLKEFSEAKGISGFERDASRVMKKYMEGYVDSIDYDNLGSIIGVKKGESDLKVMLAGHLDEVGFLVSKIEKDGNLRVHPIGGWWSHVLLGQRMIVTTRDNKEYTGVFGGTPPHILTPEARVKVMDMKALFLDLGLSSKEEVEKCGIQVGDQVTPKSEFELMANPKYLLGKAWDDRIATYIIVEVLRNLKDKKHPNTVYGVGTVQEEVGLRGAKTATAKVAPDVAIALDVTISNDSPGSPSGDVKLGNGVALSLADRSVIAHRGLFDYLKDICEEEKIPYTVDILAAGGTDSGEIHKSFDGVVNVTISIPSRHIHSHNSIVHLDDIDGAIKLLTKFCLKINKEELVKIKLAKV